MDPVIVKLPEGKTVTAKYGKGEVSEITIKPPTNAQLFDYGAPAKMGGDGVVMPDMKVVQAYLGDLMDVPIEEVRKMSIDVGLQCTEALLGFLGFSGSTRTDTSKN